MAERRLLMTINSFAGATGSAATTKSTTRPVGGQNTDHEVERSTNDDCGTENQQDAVPADTAYGPD